ncbi:MAG: DUF5665 domain-containing protein [Bdellovibrionales bacterium]
MAKKKQKDPAVVRQNRADVAKALEILFADDYISRRRLYLENFIRGMFFAVGGIIGATIVLAVLLWFLSLFDQFPLIGPVFDNLKSTIENGSVVR